MSGIREGDKVARMGGPNAATWTVEAVRHPMAWLSRENNSGRRIYLSEAVSDLVKVEPKFEVGKTYRPVSSTTLGTVRVTDVQGVWAIGWWNNGSPWTEEQGSRSYWTEVPEEDTAVAEQPRTLTEVKISTYNPEKYILHNTKEGSYWKLTSGGTWVKYYPMLPF